MATISIVGRTSTLSSWYEVWEAISALASVCVRGKQKGGKARNFGKSLSA